MKKCMKNVLFYLRSLRLSSCTTRYKFHFEVIISMLMSKEQSLQWHYQVFDVYVSPLIPLKMMKLSCCSVYGNFWSNQNPWYFGWRIIFNRLEGILSGMHRESDFSYQWLILHDKNFICIKYLFDSLKLDYSNDKIFITKEFLLSLKQCKFLLKIFFCLYEILLETYREDWSRT